MMDPVAVDTFRSISFCGHKMSLTCSTIRFIVLPLDLRYIKKLYNHEANEIRTVISNPLKQTKAIAQTGWQIKYILMIAFFIAECYSKETR